MCGIIVDMNIIISQIKELIPQVGLILVEKEENCGDYIGNNLINQGINNLFTNNLLNEDLSLLIWDFLFLEGNTVLIKSFIGIYAVLSPILLKAEKSIESYQQLINKDLREILPTNEEFLYYLLIKEYNFTEQSLMKERFNLSIDVADQIENAIETIQSKIRTSYKKNQIEIQFDKTIHCNKDWPYCINDTYFENVIEVTWFTTLRHKKNVEIKGDYFFSGVKEKIKRKKEIKRSNKGRIIKGVNNEDMLDICIERRPHFCSTVLIVEKEEKAEINKNNENSSADINSNININEEKDKEKDNKDIYEKITNQANQNVLNSLGRNSSNIVRDSGVRDSSSISTNNESNYSSRSVSLSSEKRESRLSMEEENNNNKENK